MNIGETDLAELLLSYAANARRLAERHPDAGGGGVSGNTRRLAEKYGPLLRGPARRLLASELRASPVHSVRCAAVWVED